MKNCEFCGAVSVEKIRKCCSVGAEHDTKAHLASREVVQENDPIRSMRDEMRKSMEILFKLEVKLRDLEEENHNLKLRLRIALSQIETVRQQQADVKPPENYPAPK